MGVASGLPALLGGEAGSLARCDLPKGPECSQLAHGRLAAGGQPEAALLQWEKVQSHMWPTRNSLVWCQCPKVSFAASSALHLC